MEYIARRDKNNPHWNDLLDQVKELNNKLLALANYYLGNDKKKRLTDDAMLIIATGSIADACLEVTDVACVTMTTMRSIICNRDVETQMRTNPASECKEDKNSKNELSESTQIALSRKIKGMIEPVIAILEVALSLLKSKKEEDLVHVMEHAISMMTQIARGNECSNLSEQKKFTSLKQITSAATKNNITKHKCRK